jgi:hypothetical protein
MDEQENPLIQITIEDIQEANRLSLHCPICASAVENNVREAALLPVVCARCRTLYHKACWEQSGGRCAILGCGHDKYYVYGTDVKPTLTIKYTDLPRPSVNGRAPSQQTKRLKEEQKRQVEEMRRPGFWQRVWQWLLDQIKLG